MVDLTNNTTTTVDARGSQGYQEHSWAGSGAEVGIPNTTFLYAFKVRQLVLIWYSRDGLWHEGAIVRFRGPELCEVEFSAGGPRIRNWYKKWCGVIRPDTPSERESLKANGYDIATKTPRF